MKTAISYQLTAISETEAEVIRPVLSWLTADS
jgi:hypothetical protein